MILLYPERYENIAQIAFAMCTNGQNKDLAK
jgi:hypothetical protein